MNQFPRQSWHVHGSALWRGVLASAALAFAIGYGTWARADGEVTSVTAPAVSSAQIDELIAQLGHEDFFVRERAQQQLAELGFHAFDALVAAENHADIEIAARARYLLRLMEIEWTRDDDPPEVKRLLGNYDQLDEDTRQQRIAELAKLPDDQGLAALCRLARFQRSDQLAKRAALEAIRQGGGDGGFAQWPTGQPADETAVWALSLLDKQPRSVLDAIEPERWAQRAQTIRDSLAGSSRAAASWLLTYASLRESPEEALTDWAQLVEREAATLKTAPQQTEPAIVQELLRLESGWLRSLERQADAEATMLRTLDFVRPDSESLAQHLLWLTWHEAWSVIDHAAERFSAAFSDDPVLLYTLAFARQKQGQMEQAERLAASARELNPRDFRTHFEVAAFLYDERGWIDWAEAEYRTIVEFPDPAGDEMVYLVYAQKYLAYIYHDRGDELAAIKVLEASLEVMDGLPGNRRSLRDRERRPTETRIHYLYGVHHAATGDVAKARELLKLALEHDRSEINALIDPLIELYHLPDLPDEDLQEVREIIQAAITDCRRRIEQDPDSSLYYNQLAWLVANTEGDYEEALSSSLRSLELRPDYPGHMDTLARCYYALGQLDKALETQIAAVQLEPQTGQMSRQLALFREEAAVAARATSD